MLSTGKYMKVLQEVHGNMELNDTVHFSVGVLEMSYMVANPLDPQKPTFLLFIPVTY